MSKLSKIVLLIAAAILVAVTIACVVLVRHGLSARDEPTKAEEWMARTMRRAAVPSRLRNARSPLLPTSAVLTEAREHFADHCASCHGNDGKGDTSLGRNMYPRTPDLTLEATQSMSDGELFATIENGVRLTGMPAFGDGSEKSAQASWALVHFIRHLPELTRTELAEMEKLNPRSREEWEALKEEEEFLAGGGSAEKAPPRATDNKHHH